jgi:hypothetical protein
VTAKFGLSTPEGVQGKVEKYSHSLSLSFKWFLGVMGVVYLEGEALTICETQIQVNNED